MIASVEDIRHGGAGGGGDASNVDPSLYGSRGAHLIKNVRPACDVPEGRTLTYRTRRSRGLASIPFATHSPRNLEHSGSAGRHSWPTSSTQSALARRFAGTRPSALHHDKLSIIEKERPANSCRTSTICFRDVAIYKAVALGRENVRLDARSDLLQLLRTPKTSITAPIECRLS